MYEVLNDLNKTSGITGSMVVDNDGIVIAADLDERFDGETIGALAASISSNIQKARPCVLATRSPSLIMRSVIGTIGKLS